MRQGFTLVRIVASAGIVFGAVVLRGLSGLGAGIFGIPPLAVLLLLTGTGRLAKGY